MSWAEVKHIEDYIGQKLDKVSSLLDPTPVFGFIDHMATLSPTSGIEYIGTNTDYVPFSRNIDGTMDLGSWGSFPVLANCKPAMVKGDGTMDYELDPADYTKKLDGTASDVANTSYSGAGAFSWIQKIYKSEYVVGTDRVVLFCEVKKNDSFKPVGFVDETDSEIPGVWIPMFYGALQSSALKSLAAGYPEKNQNTAAQKTAIDNAGTRARFFGGSILETLGDLLIMWAKNRNTQAVYGYGNSSGYDSTDTTNYGMKANAVISGGLFYGTSDGKALNKILHSLVLGTYNQWQRDPYEVVLYGKVFVSPNYAYDAAGSGYLDTGISTHDASGDTWRYPSKMESVEGYGPLPVFPYSGTDSTGYCDGLYFLNNQHSTAQTTSVRLGDCNNGSRCGSFARNWSNAPSYTGWYIGASPLLLAPATA